MRFSDEDAKLTKEEMGYAPIPNLRKSAPSADQTLLVSVLFVRSVVNRTVFWKGWTGSTGLKKICITPV